jgi:hypothetical protein
MTTQISTYSQSLSASIAGNMSEVEQRFQQRGRDAQTWVARISRSMMISSERKEEWIENALIQVQSVVAQLNETIKTANSIEEVHAALNSGEAREFFDVRTNRFNIKQDGELDNQENRENFEEASSMVNKLFKCVNDMVQDTWIMQREEEDRAKQAGLNRSRRNVGSISKEGSSTNSNEKGYQQTELGTAACKLRRDGQLYSLLYELGVAVRINFNARLNEDLRWMWDKLQGKQSAGQRILDSLREQYWIVASLGLEHETGMNLEKECRESRDKIENIIRELLKGKVMKEQLTDTGQMYVGRKRRMSLHTHRLRLLESPKMMTTERRSR